MLNAMSIPALVLAAGLALFPASVSADAVAEPVVTAAARLGRRQSPDQRFLGYYQVSGSGSYFAQMCASSLTFTTSGNFARCCTFGTTCGWVTKCENNVASLQYTDSTVDVPCTPISGTTRSCITDSIYRSLGDPSPQLYLGCGNDGGSIHTYYHDLPASISVPRYTVTSSSSSSSSRRTTSSTSTSSPSRTTSTSTESTPSNTSTSSPSPAAGGDEPEEKKSESKAWIAGPVVGSIAAIALAGGLFAILARRKRKQKDAPAAAAAAAGGVPPAGGQMPPQQPYPDQQYAQAHYQGSPPPPMTQHNSMYYPPQGPPPAGPWPQQDQGAWKQPYPSPPYPAQQYPQYAQGGEQVPTPVSQQGPPAPQYNYSPPPQQAPAVVAAELPTSK